MDWADDSSGGMALSDIESVVTIDSVVDDMSKLPSPHAAFQAESPAPKEQPPPVTPAPLGIPVPVASTPATPATTAGDMLNGWKMDAAMKETFFKYFNRYDLDESGEIDNAEEMRGLVTNLCVKCKIRANPDELTGACDSANVEAKPLKFEPFCEWFTGNFSPPGK